MTYGAIHTYLELLAWISITKMITQSSCITQRPHISQF